MDIDRTSINGFNLNTGLGKYDLNCSVQIIGKDILISVFGGQKPHIGAVAIAHPRKDLKEDRRNTASSSVICMQDHKEDMLAKKMSETISTNLNVTIVLTAGMHWDNITNINISSVTNNADKLANMICETYSKLKIS